MECCVLDTNLDQSSDKEGIIELNKKEKNIGDKYFKKYRRANHGYCYYP